MTIAVLAQLPNQNIPPSLGLGGLMILSGVIECVFKGNNDGSIARDTLTFNVGRVNFPGSATTPRASCIMSVASFAFDGPVTDALWAVDSAEVTSFHNVDSGSGTADLEVVGHLAVRGANGTILRVNYTVFYFPSN
jgi:hypothetical protein